MKTISEIEQEIASGKRYSEVEAVMIADSYTTDELCALADRLREQYCGKSFDTCSILNARSGRCPENCKWCSQSAFHKTDIAVYPLCSAEEALKAARYNEDKGVKRFSLVTSGRALNKAEVEKCCSIYDTLNRSGKISLCASLGLLDQEDMEKLKAKGVKRYHCNLESAPSFFPNLCTTHTTEDKIRTIRAAQKAGMEVCSGGIIGMGETFRQRMELAVALRELGVKSIPMNLLNPVPGTALEDRPLLTDDEVLKTAAMFRILNPDAYIRFAGGRILYKHLEKKLLKGGINASIVGDMLTTMGSSVDEDMKAFREEGFDLSC